MVLLLHGNAYRVLAVEGQLARGCLVQHHAQRVDVACAGEFFALRLLGRNVVGGAQHGCRLRKARVACARDAEVHYLDVAIRLDHDVLRFDVTVDHAALMSNGKRLRNLAADFGRLALVDGAAFVDGGFKVGSAKELHDDVVGFAVKAPVVDAYDVGALQVCGRSRFLAETLGKGGVGSVLRQHNLHGNRAT